MTNSTTNEASEMTAELLKNPDPLKNALEAFRKKTHSHPFDYSVKKEVSADLLMAVLSEMAPHLSDTDFAVDMDGVIENLNYDLDHLHEQETCPYVAAGREADRRCDEMRGK